MNEVVPAEPEEVDDEGLVKKLPHFLKEQVAYLQSGYFELSQEELERTIFPGGKPDLLASRLKLNFWNEYDTSCKKDGQQMRISQIIAGVCTLNQLRKFVSDKHRLTWLIQIPADYRLALSDIHELSIAQMREIMTMDNYDAKGAPNVKLLDVKFKVSQHVDMRLKGAIIQRIDQRNLNMNVNADAKPETAKDVALSMDEIENRLAELKKKSKSMLVPGGHQVDLLSGITADSDIIEINVKPQKNDSGGLS